MSEIAQSTVVKVLEAAEDAVEAKIKRDRNATICGWVSVVALSAACMHAGGFLVPLVEWVVGGVVNFVVDHPIGSTLAAIAAVLSIASEIKKDARLSKIAGRAVMTLFAWLVVSGWYGYFAHAELLGKWSALSTSGALGLIAAITVAGTCCAVSSCGGFLKPEDFVAVLVFCHLLGLGVIGLGSAWFSPYTHDYAEQRMRQLNASSIKEMIDEMTEKTKTANAIYKRISEQ